MRHNLMKSIALLLILATQAQAVTTSPDPLHQACSLSACLAADLTCDGKVDAGDALIIRSPGTWETSGAPGFVRADLNHDGLVNSGDLLMVRAPGTWKAETGPCSCDACGSNSAPVAMVEATPLESSGRIFEFDGSSSSDADGEITSYQWNLGDSTVASGSSVTHTYAQPGTYTVSLSVADSCGATGSTTIQVNYIDTPIHHTLPLKQNRVVTFSTTLQRPPGGYFDWEFSDGVGTIAQSPWRRFTSAGPYSVTLTVRDANYTPVGPAYTLNFEIEPGIRVRSQMVLLSSSSAYENGLIMVGGRQQMGSNGIAAVNISNLYAPVTLMQRSTTEAEDYVTGSFDDMDTARGIAVMASQVALGFYVWNISDPVNPFLLWRDKTYENEGLLPFIAKLKGQYAYVSLIPYSGGTRYIRVYDLADPANPAVIANFPVGGYLAKLEIFGDYLYALDHASSSLAVRIYDVSNPTQLNLVGSYPTPVKPNYLDVQGNLLVVSQDNQIHLVDITQISAPRRLSTISEPGLSAGGVVLNADDLYFGNLNDIEVYDIKNRNSPVKVEEIDIPKIAEIGRLYFDRGHIFALCAAYGVAVLTP